MDQVKTIIERIPQLKREQKYVSILAAITLLYSTYKLVNSKPKAIDGIKEIPMPEGRIPLFGHMLTLGKLPGTKIKEWHRKYGPIIQFKMGKQTWISVDDPELSHKIFVSHGVDTSYRPYSTYGHEYYSKKGKGMAFSNPGSVWQQARSAALAVLAPKQIQKYFDHIQKEAAGLATRLIQASQDSKDGISPLKYLELASMNIIFNVSFGRKFDSIDDPEFHELAHIVETSMELAAAANDLASFVPLLAPVDYFAGSQAKMKKFTDTKLSPTFKKLVKEARSKDTENLVKTLDASDFNLEEDELLVIMSDLIAGGTDTTTVTMLWNFAVMCHHPEAQQQVANEIDEFIKIHGRVPTFEDRDQIPYSISVMKECMRYRPTSPFGLPHSVQKTLVIEGYVFPKDCTILSSMESIHTNPAVYRDADKFIPDRFMDNQKTMQSAANGRLEERDHFNFGWGRRICPGIYLAEVEIFNAFVNVFARCTIEPANPAELPKIEEAKSAGVTLNPMPYKVNFVRRPNALVE